MLSTFPLAAEQIAVQNLARDFANREILPISSNYEKENIGQGPLLEKLFQSGLVNTRIPEKYGGLELSLLDTCLITEELGYACSGIASIVEVSELAITTLLLAGSPEQQKMFLAPLMKESQLAGLALPFDKFCYSAPLHSSNNLLTAKYEAGSIVLNGYVPVVLNAKIGHWFIVACPLAESTNPTSIKYFVVSNSLQGLTISENIQSLGLKALDARTIMFSNVCLDPIAEIVLSEELYLACLEVNSVIISAGGLGIAKRAYMESIKYAQERKTFGVPIASHQAISFMLADMKTDIEAAGLLAHQAAHLFDTGKLIKKSGTYAQIFSLETAIKASIDAVQILGGYGYTKDYPVEKLMRDAKTYQSYFLPMSKDKEDLGQTFLTQKQNN